MQASQSGRSRLLGFRIWRLHFLLSSCACHFPSCTCLTLSALATELPDLVYISSIGSFPINNSGGGLVKTLRQYVLQTQALLSIPWFSVSAYYEGHWRRRDREFESHSSRYLFCCFCQVTHCFCQICNLVNEPRIRPLLTICNAALQ